MRLLVVASIIVLSIAGCVSVNKKALDSKSMASIRNQTVTYTTRKMPDFAAMTPGKAMFGLLGAAAMVGVGNKIIAGNEIPDPADAIAAALLAELQHAHEARPVTPPVTVMRSDDVKQTVARVGEVARYVVDAQTVNWALTYFPLNFTHYRVLYTAKVRLIDVQTRAVVAEGFCKRVPESDAGAPTYDELLANQAALLKGELEAATRECVATLKREMLVL
ncbi:MAG: hypothetical protein JNN30_12790 [Rhodanobacteraceae bacterium]|nr:hypothetical protein [Rhodanobacteraceae bacterium]